jgi:predicted flavoprotein YhiN
LRPILAQSDQRALHGSGAEPAVLAAAVTASRAGLRVVVHEEADRMASKLHGDLGELALSSTNSTLNEGAGER